MGLNGSKIGQHPEVTYVENVRTTPISTPKVTRSNELDPRSPTAHISRTPLELLSAAAEKLEEIKQNELRELGDELFVPDTETPVRNKTILLGIDPRSPTTEFKRTPIVINVQESEVPKKIQNKNLDKVKRSTVVGMFKSANEKVVLNTVPPKLLESSPIKPKPDASKRKSFVGLLETNIDFTETDLDAVLFEKCKIKEKVVNGAIMSSQDINSENVDPHSPTNEFLRTPIYVANEIEKTKLNDELELETTYKNDLQEKQITMELKNDEVQEGIEVERVAQEICETVNEHLTKTDIDTKVNPLLFEEETMQESENNLVEVADLDEMPKHTRSAPVTPPTFIVKPTSISVVSPIHKEIKSAPVTPPPVNITADVNELDKKLTNLIYQDEDVVICPRIVELKEHSNRSPLRNCNGIEPEKRKSAQKLKVRDKPRKSDYMVSKIPIFKEKRGKSKVQCENTPPRNMEKRKTKARNSYWDSADTTLII